MELKATLNKPYTEIERLDFITEQNHNLGYEIKETETALESWGADDTDLLNQAKESKVYENDTLRDTALNQGVLYKDVLFDSDTDQKINLLAVVSSLGEAERIIWFGKDNQPLDCNKEDLINIGSLITQLHSYCWGKNYAIKTAINEASTIQEVEAIQINYKEE